MIPHRWILPLLALPGFCAAAQSTPPAAVIASKLGDAYRWYVTARINDVEFNCSLDSAGGDRIYLDRTRASAAGIQSTGAGRSAGPQAGSMTTDARAAVTLNLGGLKLPDRQLVIQDRPNAGFACIIGLTILKDYVVELDYDTATVRVHDPAEFRYRGSGRPVAFDFDQGNPFVNARLVFPNGDRVDARLAVDTGGGRPAGFLTRSFIDRNSIMNKLSRTAPDFWSGFSSGQPRVLAARLDKLIIGDTELARPIFFLFQTRGFGGATEPDGLLCPDFLHRFRVIFDYPHRKLIREPGKRIDDAMSFDASGTLLYREGRTPFRVFRVMEASPASQAGLREGDTVLEIDGKPADGLSNAEVSRMLMLPGREVTMKIQRGQETITTTLKLRALI